MAITDQAIDQAFSHLKKSCGGVRNDYLGHRSGAAPFGTQGITESRLGEDGKIRWFLTEKGRHTTPDEVPDCLDVLT